jgi:hypothetical protein
VSASPSSFRCLTRAISRQGPAESALAWEAVRQLDHDVNRVLPHSEDAVEAVEIVEIIRS